MTLLQIWNSYCAVTNTINYDIPADVKGRVRVYYEQDKLNNLTDVTIKYYLVYKLENSEIILATSGNAKASCGNGSSSSNFKQISFNMSASEISNQNELEYYVGSTSHQILHNVDGTAELNLQACFTFDVLHTSGTSIGISKTNVTRWLSFSKSLPTIPRISDISNDTSSNNLGNFEKDVTFTITPPSGAEFTHSLSYTVNNIKYNIVEDTSDLNVIYKFPSELIKEFVATNMPIITVFCTSSNGTTSNTTVYLAITDEFKPDISIEIVDMLENKSEILNNLWIQNKSVLKGNITANAKENATISNYSSDLSGFEQIYNTNPFITQPLSVSGSRIVTSKVTDSRGLTNTITENIDVIEYTNPTIKSVKVERCHENGEVADDGLFAILTINYSISPIKEKNIKSLMVQKDSDSVIEIDLSNKLYEDVVTYIFKEIDQSKTYSFNVILNDIFNPNITQSCDLGIAYKTTSKLKGGRGITHGRVATKEGYHQYMPAVFYDRFQKCIDEENNQYVDIATLNDIPVNSFAQMVTNGMQTFLDGTSDHVSTWYQNSEESNPNIATGSIYCEPSKNAICIPAGVAKCIELFGNICGSGNALAKYEIMDEDGNSLSNFNEQRAGMLIQSAGNTYFQSPLPTIIAKLDDTKDWYVKLSIQGYNKEFILNNGFSGTSSYIGVRKVS